MIRTVCLCDGCATQIGEEDAGRGRAFQLRTPFNSRDLDLCRDCWEKMCLAIGMNPYEGER